MTIVAPHGGGIEAGTSELGEAVAGRERSFSALEGIRSHENADLHVTSARFDQPRGLQAVGRSDVVPATRGRGVQSELPRGLGRRFFPALNASGRRVRTCGFLCFRSVPRGALRGRVRARKRLI